MLPSSGNILTDQVVAKLNAHEQRLSKLERLEQSPILPGSLLCPMPAYPWGGLALCNGAFEVGASPGFPVCDGWDIQPYEGEILHDTDGADGGHCLDFVTYGLGQTAGVAVNERYLEINELDDYQFTCWVKSTNILATGSIGAYCYNAELTMLGEIWPVLDSSNTVADTWEPIWLKFGAHGEIPILAGTRFLKLVIKGQTNDAIQDTVHMRVDEVQFNRIMFGDSYHFRQFTTYAYEPNNYNTSSTVFVAYPGLAVNVITPPGYQIWFAAQGLFAVNRTRILSAQFIVTIDGVPMAPPVAVGTVLNTTAQWHIFGVSPELGVGTPHVVQVEWCVVNAADTLTGAQALLLAWPSRAY